MPAFPVMNTWRFEFSMTSRALRKSGLISMDVFLISHLFAVAVAEKYPKNACMSRHALLRLPLS